MMDQSKVKFLVTGTIKMEGKCYQMSPRLPLSLNIIEIIPHDCH